ncbi:hypothetical protein MMC28_011481, partial [Mycoblastus sanguinarius]|nr:hypothetical protein [Mycoblastus sanguinarius]
AHRREPETGQQLDTRVAPRDGSSAVAAAPAQQNPADDGNVVPHPDRVPARGAVRPRRDDTLVPRHPRDNHVEKAANQKPADREAEKHRHGIREGRKHAEPEYKCASPRTSHSPSG